MNASSKKLRHLSCLGLDCTPHHAYLQQRGATGPLLRLPQQCYRGEKGKVFSYPGRPRDVQPYRESRPKFDIRPFYRIVSGQSDEWRLLFFVRLAIELLTAGSQAADGGGLQLSASRSKKQIPIIMAKRTADMLLDIEILASIRPVLDLLARRLSASSY